MGRATLKQVEYIDDLVNSKDMSELDDNEKEQIEKFMREEGTKEEASGVIRLLNDCPWRKHENLLNF